MDIMHKNINFVVSIALAILFLIFVALFQTTCEIFVNDIASLSIFFPISVISVILSGMLFQLSVSAFYAESSWAENGEEKEKAIFLE